jgi:hypothetical protein
MKKLILLMGIIIFPLNVKAEEFYTNYHLRENETENFYEESDLIKREEKYLYNNYYEKKINEGYYELDKNPIDAPLIDKKDFIYEYAGYYKNPVNDKDSVYGIGSMNMNNLNKIKYFIIFDVGSNVIFENIKIYNKSDLVSYTMTGYNFKSPEDYTNPTIKIKMDEEVNVKDLHVEFELKNNSVENYKFALYGTLEGFSGGIKYILYRFNIDYINSEQKFDYKIMDFSEFVDLLYSLDWTKKNGVNHFIYYKKRNILYKYFNICKIKTNNYTAAAIQGFLLDSDDKRKVYNYYVRDKIEIKDNWLEDEPLENMIESTSIVNKSDIKLTLNKNENDENILIIKYKDDVFYKKINVIKKEIEDIPLVDIKEDENIANEESKIKENEELEIVEEINSKDNDVLDEEIIKSVAKKYLSLNSVSKELESQMKTEELYKTINIEEKNFKMNSFVGIIFLMFLMFILRFIYKYIHENKE